MSNVTPTPSSGPMSVPITNPFVCTRVMYSRLMISQSLCMCGFLDEDVVERRLEQLETADLHPGIDRRTQDFLRVRAGFQFRLDARAEAVDGNDHRAVEKGVGAGEFDVGGVLAVGMLDGAQVAVQNVLAMINQA